jgi:hypothetical protein
MTGEIRCYKRDAGRYFLSLGGEKIGSIKKEGDGWALEAEGIPRCVDAPSGDYGMRIPCHDARRESTREAIEYLVDIHKARDGILNIIKKIKEGGNHG